MIGINTIFNRFTPVQRSLISATAGFFFYGSWAFWVNSDHGMGMGLRAAGVQGSYSFLLTLSMTALVESLFRLSRYLFKQKLLIVWATIIFSCAIIFSTSWGINYAAGTPDIFQTVILGYVIGAIYSISYVYGLSAGSTQ